ncbi:hypothetical protein NX862_06370 [Rhodobacter sp. KR11]|uniref:hypothetical protein n=1 Tax=Rhodobacter sp. KR11 TaxID=2974588 RepID=UPI002223B149|nr:hypothetical protein [Rhodobacter sp. KR11]MCW1918368.1 hypothetical protein [Rhodobacter sp. KR11]
MTFAKIDVALQAYKKPESLIYTLLTLHRHSAARIDQVFIRDDSGLSDGLAFLDDPTLRERLAPWVIRASRSSRPSGWGLHLQTANMPIWRTNRPIGWKIKTALIARLRPDLLWDENDLRYQWAVNQSDKAHLMILHDDMLFTGDIVARHMAAFAQDPKLAIVGPLGQCWRCGHSAICDPGKLMQGARPPHWPLTPHPQKPEAFPRAYHRDCRINEWCCTINLDLARELSAEGIYFGNYQDKGDVGAFWLAEVVRRGHHFADDFNGGDRAAFYIHAWQGHSGHSVWADQGVGQSSYRVSEITDRLWSEFGYRMPA